MRDWDFAGQLAVTLKIAAIILVLLCLILVWRPNDPLVWGLLVGTAVSMWNAYFLGRRLRSIADMVVSKANAHVKVGIALRLTIMFAVLFYVARTQWISLYAAGAGLFVVPLIFTLVTLYMIKVLYNRKPKEVNSMK
ncbi:MAG: hypothetical protein GX325_00680 [Peptococcaceae bacterium]|nr:hypothetical protein [Peptococcaceae bacterium]